MAERNKLGELAQLIRDRALNAPKAAPKLRLVQITQPESTAPKMDAVSREARIRRIRWLARSYRLTWLMDQGTFHVPAIECLEDAELCALLDDMERARECLQEGVPFHEAGLVRRMG